jgi:cytochrome c oxidase subunit 3
VAPAIRTLEKPAEPGGPAVGGGDWGRSGRGGDGALTPPRGGTHPARIGVWLVVGAITILFVAFTSTYLARRGQSDWRIGPLPPVLWVNTALLFASSLALERARRGARHDRPTVVRGSLAVATLLGTAFVVGQVAAWRQLASAGVFMASNPHAAFFYLLTGTHALHVAGGIGTLVFALWKTHRLSGAAVLDVVEPAATYWHFVDGLWVYLFVILFWL